MSDDIAPDHHRVRLAPAPTASAQSGGDEQFLDVKSLTANSALLKFLKVDDIEASTLDLVRIKAFDIKADKADVGTVVATTLTASSVAKSAAVETGDLRAANARLSGTLVAGQLQVEGLRAEQIRGRPVDGATAAVVSRAQAIALDHPAAPASRLVDREEESALRAPAEPAGVARRPVEPGPRPDGVPVALPPRLALFHDFGKGHDELVLNHLGRYHGGVRLAGEVHVSGALTEAAPRSDTADLQPLAVAEARRALDEVHPVTVPGADGDGTRRLGVLADRLPTLLARGDGDRVRTMDVVALLVAVVQDQQRRLDALTARPRQQPAR